MRSIGSVSAVAFCTMSQTGFTASNRSWPCSGIDSALITWAK